MKKALVVLSGGQDSTTCLAWAKQYFDEVHAITFDYGQRHRIEIEAAIQVANILGVESHEIVVVPECLKSVSPLLSDNTLEQYTDYHQMDEVIGDRVELTFVPLRNPFFFIIAANRAVKLGCESLVTGICEADNANYPDCRESFKIVFEDMINVALGNNCYQKENGWISIEAPLLHLTKAESVKLAKTLPGCMEALAYSHTSYDGKYPPTDMNHSNVLRAHGFEEAGEPDPLVVRAWREGRMDLPMTGNYDDLRDPNEPKYDTVPQDEPKQVDLFGDFNG
jgi:7-cyano-7-deazaguanine synthase